jgi:4-hydroxy-tetrahydrodipicolinate synthase
MFKGTYTAIVTPFTPDKRLDIPALERLVKAQIDGGVSGIVPCGTTGETPTLTADEYAEVIAATVRVVARKVPVIAGTGTNATSTTIEQTQRAKALGADAALVVTPYYNKPSQDGLYAHFRAVAEQGGLPVMLYNVPSRTGCDLLPETVVRLQADTPRIVAVKEAAGSVDRIAELRARCRKDFSILSGDDAFTLPMMTVGADGVVSVASNIVPEKVSELTRLALAGDFEKARALHLQLRPLFSALFIEPNPTPAKAALAMLGRMTDDVRLPLLAASEKTRAILKSALKEIAL